MWKTKSLTQLFSIVLIFSLPVATQAQTIQWAKGIIPPSASDLVEPNTIMHDAAGNVYTAGSFNGTLDFDPGSAGFTMTSTGDEDIFISKFDASGNFAWAKSIGTSDMQYASSMSIDASGNILIAGWFKGTVDFDAGSGTYHLTAAATGSSFVLKLDASGNFAWAKAVDGTTIADIQTDPSGNIFITGSYGFNADFDPDAGAVTLPFAGSTDIFVEKLDNGGNFIWVKSMGDAGYDAAQSIALDKGGNIYLTGSFNNTVDFDPGPGTMNLVSAGGYDIFLAKLNASGDLAWAKGMGGADNETSFDMVLDKDGRPCITGHFRGVIDVDPGPAASNLTSSFNLTMFIADYDTAGNFRWGLSLTNAPFTMNDQSLGKSLAADTLGNIYVAGDFGDSASFSSDINPYKLGTAGQHDAFIAKYRASDGTLGWAIAAGGTKTDMAYAISASPAGDIYNTGLFFSPGFAIGSATVANNPAIPVCRSVFVAKLNTQPNGIDGLTVNDGFAVYPNPSSGTINISSMQTIDQILITDITGRSVYSSMPHSENSTMNIATPGMYFVTVVSGEQRMMKKVVVEE